MSLLREDRDGFAVAIANAAEALGLAEAFVEKDYWVTQVLRALREHESSGGLPFTFKGGTSLSKGHAIIERFSEDVDILFANPDGFSSKARRDPLLEATEAVASSLGLQWHQSRDPGVGKHPHRADLIEFDAVARSAIDAAYISNGILLETGYTGGEWPASAVTIVPILCDPNGIAPADYPDTSPFMVRALLPARTLIEKLSLLHSVVDGFDASSPPADERCGRHFYDVYCLLGDTPTVNALDAMKANGEFDRIVGDMQAIASVHFRGAGTRPDDGYAASAAFSHAHDGELRAWLRDRYDAASSLLPARAEHSWPTLGTVLKRIQQHAHRL